jgi:flagellar motor protein MotB
MRLPTSNRSTLHLQMGQETIYLLLTMAVFAALALATYVVRQRRPYEDPPIISLSEAQGFFFATGSAELSSTFRQQLVGPISQKVRAIADKYDAHTVEVIGHTDEVPLGGTRSDLDATLVPWFLGKQNRPPVASDNTGLGMARAVAVARALRESGLSQGFTIIPLSAGSILRPDDTVTDGEAPVADEKRRRIEIRVRRRAKLALEASQQ